MYAYIARQPIYDNTKALYGYELLFRDGEQNSFPNIDGDEATSRLLTEHHLLVGVEHIAAGKLAFINFSAETLIHHFPTSIDPATTVIEILETVPISMELLQACKALHGMGYALALDDHDFDPKWDIFLPYTRYLKVDVQQFNLLQISKFIQRIKHHPVTLLAERVETAEQFDKLKLMGFTLFQGYLFARPEMMKHRQLSSNKLNLLELIGEACAEQLDFDRLSSIVERDVALSFKLLRFINNSAYAKEQSIQSLKLAMVYMGEAELKKFIALLALANLANGEEDARIIQSLVRARFCDQLARLCQYPTNPPTAFLTGLFSKVDELVEMPMAQVLSQLPLPASIRQALSERSGRLGHILALIETYEAADWVQAEKLASKLPSHADLAMQYHDAVQWAQGILQPK
ncbi:EAL and HDOD domain-containing protein [Alkalimonas amylolytica]|uniref:EAL and modified HD-GYP domain-containing signal transduction protein n=1 Tax=Alkalimonas amylolytica TaxID=152573 RepID=A0A1H4FEC4_ALKAM|nr:HDOD domain-containing protein [Alkalimonas amylolytica]SEA95635.1 EAL and modified HD-GYP domain-containing signal transduction protein [Alkalimonas amylolytica]